ncbi:MAG TPA: hypothetical protein VHD85_19520 [Terracidiphilus sp.]|nr:hypothetical protein [Terracidiphilus sp.]
MSQVGDFSDSQFSGGDVSSHDGDWPRVNLSTTSDHAILEKLRVWTALHFRSADIPCCPVCQGHAWTWQALVETSATGRRFVYRICDGCKYAMRFDADAIGI